MALPHLRFRCGSPLAVEHKITSSQHIESEQSECFSFFFFFVVKNLELSFLACLFDHLKELYSY